MKKIIFGIIIILSMYGALGSVNFMWYSQGDQRWDDTRLGNGRSSIGRSGCVVSCLSMLLNAEASNPHITPDGLNDWLRKNGGYSGSLMRWQVPGDIDGAGTGLELASQISRRNDWKYLSEELDKGNKVIVKVAGRRSHWVLVVKRDGPYDKASSYIVNDPGTESYTQRTLAYWGGFKAARSYSGNWLDEQAFDLASEIVVAPIPEDEVFLYELHDLPIPADVFVTLENKLSVGISGYFMLGLFDKNNQLAGTLDYEYATIGPDESIDLIYEMTDVSPLSEEGCDLRIIYSKHFSSVPSLFETIALPSKGVENFTDPSTN